MSEPHDSITRLADALLVAEAVYQRARVTHDRERSSLSHRVLEEARHRLEYLEGCAFDLAGDGMDSEPASDRCPACGGEPVMERWSALSGTHAQLNGQRVRSAHLLPEWAIESALRGTAIVSRTLCRDCGTEIGVVTGELD